MASRLGSSSLILFVCFNLLGGWVQSTPTLYFYNQCSSTLCVKYFGPNNGVGGGCVEVASGASKSVVASPAWTAATAWAISGSCSGQACNTGPPSGVSQFEITVDGSNGLDYYDVSIIAGYNLPIKATPTVLGSTTSCVSVACPSAGATAADGCYIVGGADETKTCVYGSTDYNIYFC